MNFEVYKDQGRRLRIWAVTIAIALLYLGTWGAYCIWVNNFTLACISLFSGGLPALSIYWFACLKEKHTLKSDISNLLTIIAFDAKANMGILDRIAIGQYRVVPKSDSGNCYEIKFANTVVRDLSREPFLNYDGMEKSIYDLHTGLPSKDYEVIYELYSRTKELNRVPILANPFASDLLKKTRTVQELLEKKYDVHVCR